MPNARVAQEFFQLTTCNFPSYSVGMTTRDALLTQIETFLTVTGMAASEFGRLVLNDTSLVKRLRDGADVRLGTADKITAFMKSHKTSVRKVA